MKLSVVILNYNVSAFLDLCLQSVEAATANIEAEIIVVDNYSSDDSCQMVRDKYPEVKLIENKENFGFSKGNNIGVENAKGEYVCILNPDTMVPEDIFEQLLNFSKNQENLGIVGCKLIDGSGNFLPESKRHIPTPWVALKKLIGWSKNYYANNLKPDDCGEVDILVGAFMLMKRKHYKELKGFDEDFFMYGEDVDLSYRSKKLGYKSWYVGKLCVLHFKGESTLKNKLYRERFFGAMKLFYKKHFKQNPLINLMANAIINLGAIIKVPIAKTINCPQSIQLFSVANPKNTTSILSKFEIITNTSHIKSNKTLILDANTLTYKSIINLMGTNYIKEHRCFKILPKNANFIVGSHSASSRGIVTKLTDL
ncbi:glycosyltransferase family 2 protein [Paucihalobacter ruber]|uniref:Glycosyltransferase family 2 protein n=1 Tax=Paucihalobacter ruber TaxID=2567861 RepID=A0A506PKH5_9FLAO|nr:glycosyltransferase family 2 protein [Paucihalobacter ruber]TPV34008.1 glycosyltransferase family 2 protein [Paucihalobacter ruber]